MIVSFLPFTPPFPSVISDLNQFRDELWSQGADGGRSAANELCEYIRLDLLSRGIPRNCKILCRGYVNLFGLAQSIHHNILGGAFDHDIHVVEDFLRGFTQARHLFDCVDVGRGHDAADIKLTENFKYYADDVRVKQIYFGGSHDNGYTRTLDQYAGPQYVNRVILLEGTPFACEIMRLPFRKVQFHGLFRESKMVNSGSTSTSRESSPQRWPYGMFVLPAPAPPAPVVQLPKASKAKIMKPVAIPQGPGGIYRNRDGQRIDPPTSKYSKAETDRVKKLKLCNVNYLRRDCPYGRRCTHDHDYKPTADELKTLALVARMAPCSSGSVCTDEKCVYGHMCAAPIKNGGKKVKGTKCCIFGEGCKFPAELHGIDGEVVKTTVVRN
ncbi:hypothetical protein GQ43DRAFT_499254 [Delitschia confertaspora ATCC 74209]|uniref:C3H1-type domain-containing protein n=1 Tax=Delitschia confertaspora ATCC 74209 TaxID=1513339 RepID=A0A9P4K029_9PLEO|nr:hypothetical protein GQ43DRAFT_499254 [Delitschia confertaspora ATCC 74209]